MASPRIFLSHATEDKALAVELAAALEKMEASVWLDHVDLEEGAMLPSQLANALSEADIAVILMTPFYLRKGWTEWELETACAFEIERRLRLVVICHEVAFQEVWERFPMLRAKLVSSLDSNLSVTADRILRPSVESARALLTEPTRAAEVIEREFFERIMIARNPMSLAILRDEIEDYIRRNPHRTSAKRLLREIERAMDRPFGVPMAPPSRHEEKALARSSGCLGIILVLGFIIIAILLILWWLGVFQG